MESALIVTAWVGGMVSGALLLMGAVGLVTGHVVINPRHIDWSVGEGRLLGGIQAALGLYAGVCTLVFALGLGTGVYLPPAMLIVAPLIPVGGTLCIVAVGRHHDARNPSKRYWSW